MTLPLPLDHIRHVLAGFFADQPVQLVELFGSYARNEATAASDIDIVVTLAPGRPVAGFDLYECEKALGRLLGLKVEMFTQLSDYLRQRITPDLKVMYRPAD